MTDEKDIILPTGQRSLTFGIGWRSREGPVDLDASVACYRYDFKCDHTFFRHKKSLDKACTHSGDNRVGGDGILDDEQIVVDLEKVNMKINTLCFIVNTFEEAKTFMCLKKGFARLRNDMTGKEIYRMNIKKLDVAGIVFCKIYRFGPTQWRVKPVYLQNSAKTFDKCLTEIKTYLDYPPTHRTFRLTVHEAKDLPLPDGDAINPYFVVKYDSWCVKSKAQKGLNSVTYDVTYTLSGEGLVLEINFWSKKKRMFSGRDLFIGRINVYLPDQQENIIIQPTWESLIIDEGTPAHSGQVLYSLMQE